MGAALERQADEEKQGLLADDEEKQQAPPDEEASGAYPFSWHSAYLNETAEGLKTRLGLAPQKPKTRLDRLLSHLPELSYHTRVVGFVACLTLGLLLSLTSLSSFSAALMGNPAPFACKYTLGNLLSLGSYCFLVGPSRQCRGMCAPERRLATLAYVLSLVGTLVCVFVLRSHLLTLLALCVQCASMVYYALSYLPFGHALLRRALCGS